MKSSLFYISLLFTGLLTFSGCQKYFDTNPDDILVGDKYVGSVNELYSGYMGIASKVQKVSDQAVFLTGLRGDLLEPTQNAPQALWDIYNHTDVNGNSFTDPRGYYDIIINANDYIAKAFDYKKKNPNAIDDAIFAPLISGAIRFKCWTYLMIAKIYGEAVYFDDPLVNYTDLSKYPVYNFDQMIQQCLNLMETGVNGIDGKQTLVWSDLLAQSTSVKDITWDMICPSPVPLLTELNLWAGNYQKVVDLAIPFIYDDGSKRYKASNEDYNQEWCQFFYADPATKTKELINVVPFDYQNNQTNRLISFFSNMYPSKYYLRPTQVAMDRFTSQVRQDGITVGDKYRGDGYTFVQQDGQWVIRKFTRNRETPDLIYKNDVSIILYRAADMHLFLAEALNNLQKFPEAEAFLNDGVEAYLSKFAGALRAPLDNPVYNAALGTNWGIRRRIDLGPAIQSKASLNGTEFVDTLNTYQDTIAYQKAFDQALVNETCMESAGEARAYFAMIRMARRWNDPSILADRVSAKYDPGKQNEIHSLLMDPKNWFVNYDLKNSQ